MEEKLSKAKNIDYVAEPFILKSALKEEQFEALQNLADKLVEAINS